MAGSINVSALPLGSYMLGIAYEDRYRWLKLVKELLISTNFMNCMARLLMV